MNQFKIDYEESEIHSKLWRPTFDLLLISRVSREDSLVTLSSAFPLPLKKDEDIHILTNDQAFMEDFMDDELAKEINDVFAKYDIKKPQLMNITGISCNGSKVNLTIKQDDDRSIVTLKDKVIDCISAKNINNLIGKTISVPKRAPGNVICFELPANTILKDNQFLVFIGKGLDFIYTTKIKVTGYLDNMQPIAYPYRSNENKKLSFSLFDIAQDGNQTDVSDEIITKIRESGNLLFMHPDSES